MTKLTKAQEEEVIELYEAVATMQITPNQARKKFMAILSRQKKEIIEEIIKWSRANHTGNIDELYEVNLSDLLRMLEQYKQSSTRHDN